MTKNIDFEAHQLYTLLADGGLALTRTSTGYGLVAMRSDAVRRIYALKGRAAVKPCVTVATMTILDDIAKPLDADMRQWLIGAAARWPMALINELNPASKLLASWEPFVRAQCTKVDTIATFFGVGDLVARAADIAYQHGELLVGSSANRSGTGNNYTIEDVPEEMRTLVDRVFDFGATHVSAEGKLASSILDLTRGGIFQRQGVSHSEIESSWEQFRSLRRAA